MLLKHRLRIVWLVKRTGALIGPLVFFYGATGGIDLALVASKHKGLFGVRSVEIGAWIAFGLLVASAFASRWMKRNVDADKASRLAQTNIDRARRR